MIRLFTCWYDAGNPGRQAELQECLERNLANPHIGQVVLWKDSGALAGGQAGLEVHEKNRPPTFDDLFLLANATCRAGDIAVAANSDIWFDDTLALAGGMGSDECYALLRWESDGRILSANGRPRSDSQDAWIFRAPILHPVGADFGPGRPRCDNALAYRLWKLGYDLQNPALSIRTHHVHASGIRQFASKQHRIPRPWMHLEATKMEGRGRMNLLRWKLGVKESVQRLTRAPRMTRASGISRHP